VSGQFHAPFALPPRKESPVPIGQEVARYGEEKKTDEKINYYRNTRPNYVNINKKGKKGKTIPVTGRGGP
jgi:hypothetical protein